MCKGKCTKSLIIDNIYNKTDIQHSVIHKVVDEFLEEIKEALAKDWSVELRGFGTFEVRTRNRREKARNPKSGEVLAVERHGVVFFRSGRELKENAWYLR